MLQSFCKVLLLLLMLFCNNRVYAQTRTIDHIRRQFITAGNEREIKQAILSMCDQFYSLSSDSLTRYINLGKQYFSPGSDEYLKIMNFYSFLLFKSGKYHEGIEFSDSILKLYKIRNRVDPVAMELMSTYGGGLIRNGDNKESIEHTFNVLEKAEKANDTLTVIKSYVLLGWANMELNQYTESIRWLQKGLNYTKNEKIFSNVPFLFSNIASCYNNIGKYDSALYFINISLKYNQEQENLTGIANSLNIRGDIYINRNNPAAAEKDMEDALACRRKIGDLLYLTSDMAQLSAFYASVNETGKGILIAKEGIDIASKNRSLNKLIFLYSSLAENYKVAKMPSQYASSLETIIRLKDSLYKRNSGEAIAEMEVKYQLQKQQNIISKQNYALTRSRYLIIGSVILFIPGIILAWVLYRNYRLSQQKKMETAMAAQKLLSVKAIETAREQERKRIAADLHDNLGSYAAAISANVKYLQDIDVEESNVNLQQLDANAQSMVTQLSDTIWVLKNEHLPITGLADRFKLWLLRIMENYPKIQYHYHERIEEDIAFTPARILHIFLILKECVNNALKHSGCSALHIDFYSCNHWVITISDNGSGFEAIQYARGSGIDNIKNRAAASGWKVNWEKNEPNGTKVIITGNG